MRSGAGPRGRTDMIIDAHTHIYPDRVAHRALRTVIGNTGGHLDAFTDGTRDGLLASMNKETLFCGNIGKLIRLHGDS